MSLRQKHIRRVTPLTDMDNLDLLDYAYSFIQDWDFPLTEEERALMLHIMTESVVTMRKRVQPPTLPICRAGTEVHAAVSESNAASYFPPNPPRQRSSCAVIDVYR